MMVALVCSVVKMNCSRISFKMEIVAFSTQARGKTCHLRSTAFGKR